MNLLSDAGQIQAWGNNEKTFNHRKSLYFHTVLALHFTEKTGIVPPKDVDVFLVAPKVPGTSLRTLFLKDKG